MTESRRRMILKLPSLSAGTLECTEIQVQANMTATQLQIMFQIDLVPLESEPLADESTASISELVKAKTDTGLVGLVDIRKEDIPPYKWR